MKRTLQSFLFLSLCASILTGCGGGGGSDIANLGDEGINTTLPPDPGEAGKATLEGIDSDGDGVRDDVQRWIELENENQSADVKKALRQSAKAMQSIILSSKSTTSLEEIEKAQLRAQNCLFLHTGAEKESMVGLLLSINILNSEDRKNSFQNYLEQASTIIYPNPGEVISEGKIEPCD